MGIRILLLTSLALCFFAANSVLCRMALSDSNIDAYSFSIIRLTSGAVALVILFSLRHLSVQTRPNKKLIHTIAHSGSWLGGLSLSVYAFCFSWAYLSLETGTGALLLFGAVQVTLIATSLWRGQTLRFMEWLGLFIAFSGLVFLVLPNLQTPAWKALIAMTLSGLAWGIYTYLGQRAESPLRATMGNFIKALPFCILILIVTIQQSYVTVEGIYLALLSGALASGVGYAIWYSALTNLSAMQAGVVQLLVPILAAIGGALFVMEPITLRLAIAAVWVLGGIFIVLMAKNKPLPSG